MTKISYKEQVSLIATQTGTTHALTKAVLDAYKLLALSELREHRIFRFGHLAMVYSNEIEYTETPVTTAYMALNISNELGHPYFVTLGVLRSYIELAETQLRNGNPFDLVGVIKLKAAAGVHANLSKHIYNSISTIDYRLRTRVLTNFREVSAQHNRSRNTTKEG